MTVAEWIVAITLFFLAAANAIVGALHFFERGFLLNNAYLFATKDERKRMNKKTYYRQSAVAFCLLSVVFLLNGLSVSLKMNVLTYVALPVVGLVVVYALVSSVVIAKKEKREKRGE